MKKKYVDAKNGQTAESMQDLADEIDKIIDEESKAPMPFMKKMTQSLKR